MDFGKRIRNRQYPPERCGYCLFFLPCLWHIFKHIFNKDAVARGGVADENVGDSTPLRCVASLLRKHCAPHDPAVLHDRTARQVWWVKGNKIYSKISTKKRNAKFWRILFTKLRITTFFKSSSIISQNITKYLDKNAACRYTYNKRRILPWIMPISYWKCLTASKL